MKPTVSTVIAAFAGPLEIADGDEADRLLESFHEALTIARKLDALLEELSPAPRSQPAAEGDVPVEPYHGPILDADGSLMRGEGTPWLQVKSPGDWVEPVAIVGDISHEREEDELDALRASLAAPERPFTIEITTEKP